MKSILFYTGLLAGTFWACGGGGNEEPTPEPPIPSVEKIEMKVAVSGIQAWGEMSEKFEDGQNIGLFAVNRESAGTKARLTSASGNQVNNVKIPCRVMERPGRLLLRCIGKMPIRSSMLMPIILG